MIASTALSTSSSSSIISTLIFGKKSPNSTPVFISVKPLCLPLPLASKTVIPRTPISSKAIFTSSILKGFIIASIFFIKKVSPHVKIEQCIIIRYKENIALFRTYAKLTQIFL